MTLGITITASHNAGRDNGLKITDFDGACLREEMEPVLERFVVEAELENAVKELTLSIEKVFLAGKTLVTKAPGLVVLGHDTRVSSPNLHNLVR